MTEQLHFSELWPHWPELLAGLWVTVQLTVLATIGGLAIGILGAAIRSGRPGMLSRVWGGYVEIIRNTPFVVQLFFIVFGLPNLGLKMTAGEAALLAMMVNLGSGEEEADRLFYYDDEKPAPQLPNPPRDTEDRTAKNESENRQA